MALFIPDEILVVDTREQQAWTIQYDFTWCVAGEEETVSHRGYGSERHYSFA